MDTEPLISIIITCYNGERFIEKAIESILRQELQNFEVLVVDDASTDSSESVVEEYLSDTRFNYVKSPTNKGTPATRNIGIRRSKGDYIAILDQDDYWAPDFLSRLVEESKGYPDAGLIYCDYYVLDEKSWKRKTRYNPTPPSPRVFLKKLFLFRISVETFLQIALIKRECFDSLGYLDESLTGLDDCEFWLRVAGRYQMKRVPVPLVVKRLHERNLIDAMGERIFTEQLSISSSCAALYPELARYKGRRNSSIFNSWAVFLMSKEDIEGARSKLKQGIQEYRFNVLSYLGLMALSLGKTGRYCISFPRWLRIHGGQTLRSLQSRRLHYVK